MKAVLIYGFESEKNYSVAQLNEIGKKQSEFELVSIYEALIYHNGTHFEEDSPYEITGNTIGFVVLYTEGGFDGDLICQEDLNEKISKMKLKLIELFGDINPVLILAMTSD